MKKRVFYAFLVLFCFIATPAYAELRVWINNNLSLVSIPKHGESVGPWDLPMQDGVAEWKIESAPYTGDFHGFMTHEALARIQKEKNLTIKVVSKASTVQPNNTNGLYLVLIKGREAEVCPIIFDSEKINRTWIKEGKWNGGYFYLDQSSGEYLKDKEGNIVYWTPQFGEKS